MKLSRLEPSSHVKGRVLLHLEDGSLLKVTENEVLRFSLYPGMEITGEQLAALTEAGRASAARERGARLLAARPLSRQELVKRLTDKGEEPRHAEAAADWLEELGALNDADYAACVVRHYAAKGYGLRRLKDELFRRGVPRPLWEEALAAAPAPEDGVDAYLRRKLRGESDPRAVKRAVDGLLRRGFSWEDIRAGLRRQGADQDECEG